VRVIATPGHTPGHISLYLPELDTIISGDAMALENGKPVIANPQFTLNMEEAAASMERFILLSRQKNHLLSWSVLNL
jgi:glyoxylase-like metal-dependent hydrolase (beta-lactamase superfamily II)